MKLMNIKNLERFFEVVDSCTGKVELVSNDMRINLKSNLAKYFSFASLFASGTEDMKEVEIVAYDMEDAQKLIRFAMEQ